MRDLKLKVWDHDEREWIELKEDTFIAFDARGPVVIEGNEYYGQECENAEIVECTGVNSTDTQEEIYRGYIVQRISATPGGIDFIGEVTFREAQYWIENGKDAVPLFSETDKLIILGNKFENPELLEA